MPLAVKAAWIVTAGVIPGERIDKYTKRWDYTSADYEADSKITEPQDIAKFSRMRAEAMDYLLQMSNPRLNNWAKLEFIWY